MEPSYPSLQRKMGPFMVMYLDIKATDYLSGADLFALSRVIFCKELKISVARSHCPTFPVPFAEAVFKAFPGILRE